MCIRPAHSISLTHSRASIFCRPQCLFSTRVEGQNRKSPPARLPLSCCRGRRNWLLNALSVPCRQSPNPRGASTTYRFLCLGAHQIITISHRAHIHPIAGCRHRKISRSSKSFRDAHFSCSLATLFFPVSSYTFIFDLVSCWLSVRIIPLIFHENYQLVYFPTDENCCLKIPGV